MQRSKIIYGPAFITWNGGTYFTQGNITLKFGSDRFRIMTSAFGPVSSRMRERAVSLSFVPCGEWEKDTMKLFAVPGDAEADAGVSFSDLPVGSSILHPSRDADIIVTPLDGSEITTFNCGCITKLPSLKFTAVDVIIGAVEFMCLGKNDTDWSVAGSLYTTVAGTPNPDISKFNVNNIITKGYEGQWDPKTAVPPVPGIDGFEHFESIDGFGVDFGMEVDAFVIDSAGIIDYRLKSFDLKMTVTPVGPTGAQMSAALPLQGAGASRGHASNSIMADFIIADGESPTTKIFTGHYMSLVDAEVIYGQSNRFGACVWESNRTVVNSKLTKVFTIEPLTAP